jgi:flagellar FliJ protein
VARFIFKLEGVLRQRKHVEREKQRALAFKQQALVGLQAQLQRLQDTVQQANGDVRTNRLVGRLDMQFLAAHRRFLAGMQRQALGIVQKIALAQRAVDESRAELAEAARQRKVIEKLREKQFERWRAEQNRRELAQLDEIGMQLAYENLTGDSPAGSGSSAAT